MCRARCGALKEAELCLCCCHRPQARLHTLCCLCCAYGACRHRAQYPIYYPWCAPLNPSILCLQQVLNTQTCSAPFLMVVILPTPHSIIICSGTQHTPGMSCGHAMRALPGRHLGHSTCSGWQQYVVSKSCVPGRSISGTAKSECITRDIVLLQ